MPSMIAWLDASRDDQRRMHEIVDLFTQSQSRDELGIGHVRDAFSDSLFRDRRPLRPAQPADLRPFILTQHLLPPRLEARQGLGKLVTFRLPSAGQYWAAVDSAGMAQ